MMPLKEVLSELRGIMASVDVGRVANEWAAPFGWKVYLQPGDVLLTQRPQPARPQPTRTLTVNQSVDCQHRWVKFWGLEAIRGD